MRRTTIKVLGRSVPLYAANTIVVGAGAAGMNAAVQLVRQWRSRGVNEPQKHVLVVTGGVRLGASRMSGSDKQTYYKLGTSPRVSDSAVDFARALTAFGCCHGDTALAEGIGSLRAFHHLVEAGVPFPHDPNGAFIGYKTDHDPCERATSAGPKTSRFMSECLQAQAQREGVRIIDHQSVAEFITAGEGAGRRIVGMLCLDQVRRGGDKPALTLFAAENWILAAGGPGDIYRSSVYPKGQYGIHGAAFQAGLEACNLTESQYGLASVAFRWNVSGTYMQVIPRIFSTNAAGKAPREFLTEYFPDMASMATAIFLKGYQWPFDAQRIAGHQSSLIDMAVHQETALRGRRVWMDFLHNPIGRSGWDEFHLSRIGDEALEYLERTEALQALPIERLAHMNTPAVDIYAENGIDLRRQPLEIAICAQHQNGGFAANKWWESNLRRTFVVGEMAGTHGVKRPGGSALNAGQVGGMRAAECIAAVYGWKDPNLKRGRSTLRDGAAAAVQRLDGLLKSGRRGKVTPEQAMDEVRTRMTRYGAHLRNLQAARRALASARRQYARLIAGELRVTSPRQLPAAARAIQQCLTHLAMLKAIVGLLERGSGSRGSHCVLAETGQQMHPRLIDPATRQPYRFRPENPALRNHILYVTYNPDAGDLFDLRDEVPRPTGDYDEPFEIVWEEFREGKIFGIESRE